MFNMFKIYTCVSQSTYQFCVKNSQKKLFVSPFYDKFRYLSPYFPQISPKVNLQESPNLPTGFPAQKEVIFTPGTDGHLLV